MKTTLLFATFFLTTLTMVGSGGLTWNCLEGQTGFQGNGNCAPGPADTYSIVLTGANGSRVAQNVTTGAND